jgi:hypothetical protein
LNRVWRTIYATTITTVLAGLGAIVYCVATNRSTAAIGSLTLFLVGVIGFRMAWEIDVLHRRRMRLTSQERLFEAERCVYDADIDRARHELAAQEEAAHVAIAVERANMARDLRAERDQMRIEFASMKTTWQMAAFAKGFEMGENGIAPEQHSADVIVLPVGANAPTIMGTGTTRH